MWVGKRKKESREGTFEGRTLAAPCHNNAVPGDSWAYVMADVSYVAVVLCTELHEKQFVGPVVYMEVRCAVHVC